MNYFSFSIDAVNDPTKKPKSKQTNQPKKQTKTKPKK